MCMCFNTANNVRVCFCLNYTIGRILLRIGYLHLQFNLYSIFVFFSHQEERFGKPMS